MLHLKSHKLRSTYSRGIHLSPVVDEDDELIQAIADSHEERWQLEPVPDSRSLTDFWSGVEEDLAKDPNWFRFNDDDA